MPDGNTEEVASYTLTNFEKHPINNIVFYTLADAHDSASD